jgi:dUTP pyrophosphatase
MKIKALRDLSKIDIDLQEMTKYAGSQDAGIDLVACLSTWIPTDGRAIIPTGIGIQLPPACFGLILPRSGLAKQAGIDILGGVIDEGYTGEIIVNLANHGHSPYHAAAGDRIAQLVILPYFRASLEWVDELESTDRGDKGHGSTGK